jgi:hypothetical protein
MEPLALALNIILLGLSVIMLVVSVIALRRPEGKGMLWVFVSFLGFTVLSTLALLGELFDDPTWDLSNGVVLILLLVIGANYLLVLKG